VTVAASDELASVDDEASPDVLPLEDPEPDEVDEPEEPEELEPELEDEDEDEPPSDAESTSVLLDPLQWSTRAAAATTRAVASRVTRGTLRW
jgi:hypothetical protein